MFYGRACAFCTLAIVTVLTLPAVGQSVISTHSGIVHFFEGAVYVGDQPLESHPGKFSSVPQGAQLRTAKGRAEVLLTPGVFVRIGEQSEIRMVANALSNTRVELLAGSVIVDSAGPNSGTSVTLLYKNWSVRFPDPGVFRIDSDPPRVSVLRGEAEVSAGENQQALLVKHGMDVPLAPVLVPEQSSDQPQDALGRWAEGRQQSISTDNAIAANIQDPASMIAANPGYDTFTYFPMLGLSASGPTSYSAPAIYQPGFNSIYLPGYTYQPLLLGLYPVGLSTPLGSPYHSGVLPFPPRGPVVRPTPTSPISLPPIHMPTVPQHPIPVHPGPVHPGPVHPGPGVAGHVAVHR